MSEIQADLDAQAQILDTLTDQIPTIATSIADLVAEVNAFKTANPAISTVGLDGAVSKLAAAFGTLAQAAAAADPGAQQSTPAPAPVDVPPATP